MNHGFVPDAVPTASSYPGFISNPDAASRLAVEGDGLFASGRFAEAKRRYAECLRLCPDEGKYHLLLAVCDWSEGRSDVAGDGLRTAVRLSPQLAAGHDVLGQWYLHQGMLDLALESTAQAVALAPGDVRINASRLGP